jgi:PEP-CTERM motif
MKHTLKSATAFFSTLFTLGLLSGGAQAALSITDVTGSVTSGRLSYTDNPSYDALFFAAGNVDFFRIFVESPNALLIESFQNHNFGADVNFSGIEANDDWGSATISKVNSIGGPMPTLSYNGGAIATLVFPGSGDTYDTGVQYRVTFAPVPEPSSLLLLGLGGIGFILRRRPSK